MSPSQVASRRGVVPPLFSADLLHRGSSTPTPGVTAIWRASARYNSFSVSLDRLNLHNISNLAIMPSNRNLSHSHLPTRTDAGRLPRKAYKSPHRSRSLSFLALVASSAFARICPTLIRNPFNSNNSPRATPSISSPCTIRPTFTITPTRTL